MLTRFLVSYFKTHIQSYLECNVSLNKTYVRESYELANFDLFLATQYPDATEISKEIVLKWLELKPHQKEATRTSKLHVIRGFCKFLTEHGVSAWIVPRNYFPRPPKYIARIFSLNELKAILDAVDSPALTTNRMAACFYPVLFRLLMCTGMRVGEVVNIQLNNIDLNTGVIRVQSTKTKTYRNVALSLSVFNLLKEYIEKIEFYRTNGAGYIFSYNNGKSPVSIHNVYEKFRIALALAKIPHLGRGKGPRLHDLRHTFCVIRING